MGLGKTKPTTSEPAVSEQTQIGDSPFSGVASSTSSSPNGAITRPYPSIFPASISKDELINLYRLMYRIRRFEETCGQNYALGNIRGFLHLYIGQEATGVGAISVLQPQDYIVTHYRDHGHALARGLDINRTMAEMFGKRTGISKGKGGSMHIFDIAKRFMGGHAIVGAQLPLAAGIALAQQYMETNAATIVFFGDGAVNQGTFHETLNLASVWQLPVLFFMENNLYGMGSAVGRVRLRGADFTDAMAAYDVDAVSVDGMDVIAVREATQEALKKIRADGSPVFIEAKTFRFVGHSYADPGDQYRERTEIDQWRQRDPLISYPKLLIQHNVASEKDISDIKSAVDKEIADAVDFAATSSEPDLNELFNDVYA